MASQMHVEVEKPRLVDDRVRISGRVRGHPRWSRRNGRICFETPASTWDWLAICGRGDDRHDVFLRAVIWSAMEAGRDLIIHGRVSRQLLRNLERYQEIVCRWWPKYRPVCLQADEEVADAVARAGGDMEAVHPASAVLAFSGGLDSIESIVAHKRGWRGRNALDVAACVFVHGFDIPLDSGAFQAALARARTIADHYGLEVFPVRSNLKRMLPRWITTFSAAICAALSLFERRFSIGLLAASTAYENLHWVASEDGSTPLTDPLFSSATFRVVHDLAVTRVEKTQRLAGERTVWKNLRVCWQGNDLSTNCGRCEKCVRQMLAMLACGVDDFSAFQAPLSPSAILATELSLAVVVEEWQRCYAHATQRGLEHHAAFVAMKQVLENAPLRVAESSDATYRGRSQHSRSLFRSLWRRSA